MVLALACSAHAQDAVKCQDANGRIVHGVGVDPNIVMASLKAALGAVLRMIPREGEESARTAAEAASP